MTLYQLSSRACYQPATLQLLSRECSSGDAVLLLEAISSEQLAELHGCLSGADLYRLVTAPSSIEAALETCTSITAEGWLSLIAGADQTVTL